MNTSASQEMAQPRAISDDELALIRKTFSEDLLKSMRAVMLGLVLTLRDKSIVRAAFSDEMTCKVVWRRFVPELDRDTPIGQVQDTWLGVEQMIFGVAPETIKQSVEYKERAIDMTRTALDLLKNPDGQALSMKYSPSMYPDDPLQIHLLARNQFIRHVESQLLFLHLIASQKPEEKKGLINKNSSK